MPLYAENWGRYDFTRGQRLIHARQALAQIRKERAEPEFSWISAPCHIIVMAEDCTDGIWQYHGADGLRPISASELPVPARMAARCLLWAQCHEDHEDAWFENQHVAGAPEPPFRHFTAINRRGFRLACALKRALPAFTVEFFDENSSMPWRSYRPGEDGREAPRFFEITPEILRHETTTCA